MIYARTDADGTFWIAVTDEAFLNGNMRGFNPDDCVRDDALSLTWVKSGRNVNIERRGLR